jgi:nucleotide-binding universal stress UspA family protein
MQRYERIQVCIDRPQRDVCTLPYVRAIARLADSREIHLLHVAEAGVSGAVQSADGASGQTQITPEMLRALAGQHFADSPPHECLCEVYHGTPLLETLRYAHDKDIDLIVLGRHHGQIDEADDEAVLARRITRKATCSVLVLPDRYELKANVILVPIRDSECSAAALDVACGIAAATGAAVIAFNVYRVHPGYSRVGKTLEEHQALLETAARREYEQLLKRLDRSTDVVRCACAPDLRGKPVPVILQAIENLSADVVVIGARGRTGAAGVLLGTVTEQLIRQSPVPVLAVKRKGECLGVLQALLTLTGEA